MRPKTLVPEERRGSLQGSIPSLSFNKKGLGSRCGASAPAPEPAEKFRRCKREKMQLSRTTPPPSPQPHPRGLTPGVQTSATLDVGGGASRWAFPGARGDRRGQRQPPPLPSATRAARPPRLSAASPPPGHPLHPQPAPAPARPPAPLYAGVHECPQLTPPRRGRGSGGAFYIGVGIASRGRWVPRSGGISFSLWQTLCISRSPSPCPHLHFSLSALFSGLITFRIKAKPSPGCEYNAPRSSPGEERGAGAPRAGRGRGRAPQAARRRRGRGAREAAQKRAPQRPRGCPRPRRWDAGC
ncbi:uncharacterized protein PS065_018505 [Dugong dugon]